MILFEELALFSLEFSLAVITGFVCIALFIILAVMVMKDLMVDFDHWVFNFMRQLASPEVTSLMKTVSVIGNFQFISFPVLIIFIYYLFIRRHRWYSLRIPVVALGSIAVNILLKSYFDRPRPVIDQWVQASGLSFPSGHAMFNMSFFGLLIFILFEKTKNPVLKWIGMILCAIMILLIGASRIYLGVHYPSDVLAGFAAGLLWLIMSLGLLHKVERFVRKRANIIPEEVQGDTPVVREILDSRNNLQK